MYSALKDFDFLLTSVKNVLFLDNLRTLTSAGNRETFIFLYISSTLFIAYISVFENSQNSPPPIFFLSILVCKILQFWKRTTDLDNPLYFFKKVDTLGLLKIHIMLSLEGNQKKKVSAHGLGY